MGSRHINASWRYFATVLMLLASLLNAGSAVSYAFSAVFDETVSVIKNDIKEGLTWGSDTETGGDTIAFEKDDTKSPEADFPTRVLQALIVDGRFQFSLFLLLLAVAQFTIAWVILEPVSARASRWVLVVVVLGLLAELVDVLFQSELRWTHGVNVVAGLAVAWVVLRVNPASRRVGTYFAED